jgi:hypothetical protein
MVGVMAHPRRTLRAVRVAPIVSGHDCGDHFDATSGQAAEPPLVWLLGGLAYGLGLLLESVRTRATLLGIDISDSVWSTLEFSVFSGFPGLDDTGW